MIGIEMNTVATTRMSSKGQIVIPEEIRNALHLKTGTKFVVVGEGDVVVLKTITPPSSNEFKNMILKAREAAYEAGMTPGDIEEAISAIKKIQVVIDTNVLISAIFFKGKPGVIVYSEMLHFIHFEAFRFILLQLL
jgi:AbrB family looped-hinge helix DNA binding protein